MKNVIHTSAYIAEIVFRFYFRIRAISSFIILQFENIKLFNFSEKEIFFFEK